MTSKDTVKNNITYSELFFGMALYGSTLPVIKIVTLSFPAFFAGGLRLFISVLFLLPFTLKYKQAFKNISKKDYLAIFMIAFSGVFLFSVFMFYGMNYASGVVGSFVMITTLVVTAIGSIL